MLEINTIIGICAHNEERKIGKLLNALFEHETNVVSIIRSARFWVVSANWLAFLCHRYLEAD
jgi:hypothetical protein